MFARLTTVQTLPGKLEEAIAIFKEEVIPTLKRQKGFHRALLLTHPATAKAVSITLWDSETDQLASEAHGSFRQQLSKVSVLLSGPPVRQDFVVSVEA